MKIDELIRRCGEEVMTQYVDECVSGATMRKGFTELRIGTTGMSVADLANPEASQNVGVIVWLPRAKVKEILESDK
jgi:hypothetical protein